MASRTVTNSGMTDRQCKVRTVCGTRTELVTALAGGETEQAATATAHAQVASRWPGATILNTRHHT